MNVFLTYSITKILRYTVRFTRVSNELYIFLIYGFTNLTDLTDFNVVVIISKIRKIRKSVDLKNSCKTLLIRYKKELTKSKTIKF